MEGQACTGFPLAVACCAAGGPLLGQTPLLLSQPTVAALANEYGTQRSRLARDAPVNGTRSVRQITDALATEYGPVPQELVLEYLQALEKIGVLQRR